ncbi:DNA ligase D [Methylocystis heyeri]|uniref:DNA ligase (ATP) n=1 Tax=Methylocystis heyeri TaxID=391905 RepID=A0A6B8KHU5_9HYPH|nr:DNA ligase D [Methylocystis heyeri]QGM46545.1 DNA ligase D [Methylocystis heyeri]
MALQAYREKRDFSGTPEPYGAVAPSEGSRFVVQKHAARRLHYDLRLEMDGALKSWAVTRGPSLAPGEKRLAVHVEDHPLEYGDFEGVIPKGEYGAGKVIVWDRGRWSPIGNARKGYEKGHLDFELFGEKLKGRWHLVRMRKNVRDKHENWLLIKGEDEFAQARAAPDILEERPESVKSGRPIAQIDDKPIVEPAKPAKYKGAKKSLLPAFVEPMLASLTETAPSGGRWFHEIKFDGYRIQARIEAGRVRLLTRRGLDWSARFGKRIVDALGALELRSALIDGEIVVENAAGASDFSALQTDLSEGRGDRFRFYAFDLLYLDGFDLRSCALKHRRELLRKIVPEGAGALGFSAHFDEDGPLVLRHCCRLGLEGIISKLADAPYRSGRAKSWLKAKCLLRQEFVIGGFAPATASRNAVGSLALGVFEKAGLRHVGRVGTGFSAAVAERLFAKLNAMPATSSPFCKRLGAAEARGLRFVRPELVAEVEFRGWTHDGHLRHASFCGLREDKPAREVVLETPDQPHRPEPERSAVKMTHLDRLYWPESGVTKQGLADYYAEVWLYMRPFVIGRPLALLRCPDGTQGQCFFQKHGWRGINPKVALVKDPGAPGEPALISIDDFDGLMGLVQGAALEIHAWGAGVADWERPDMITIDLDPGEGVGWADIVEAAQETRERLAQAGLAAFVKTSGGKGLHVVSPLLRKVGWSEAKSFTKGLAEAMKADSPARYVSTITKARRKDRIFVDYLRNQRGATAVAAYSTRARPGAAVSMPLDWAELGDAVGPAYFTVDNAPTRLSSLNLDPWKDFFMAAAPLELKKGKRRKAA